MVLVNQKLKENYIPEVFTQSRMVSLSGNNREVANDISVGHIAKLVM